jgi:REP element-mobilizing transposase RayT
MYAHITWHTWQRVGCVDAHAVAELRIAVMYAEKRTGVRVIRGAFLADHVHLVVSFRPDTQLADFVRIAKSVGATRANRRVPGALKWARGYFVTTLHPNDLPRTLRYVDGQFRRHPDLIPRGLHASNVVLTPGASPAFTE